MEFVSGTCAVAINPEFHVPKSVSGTADLPGSNLMVTLGLWDNFLGTPFVQAATTFHELGHNLDITHGGLPATLGSKALGTANYFEPNCKPNYLSSMSYMFQVFGLFRDDDDGSPHLDYSRSSNGFGAPPQVDENSLQDGALGPSPPTYRPSWFVPADSNLAATEGLTAATRFCSGSKFNPASLPYSDGSRRRRTP